MQRSVSGLVVACAAACFGGWTATAHGETIRWSQYGLQGLEARAITDEVVCPVAKIDGVAMPMQARAMPGKDFAVMVCSVALPATAHSVTIGDAPVGLPVAAPQRIAVLGDTGCRLKGSYLQDCNDPLKWPFAQVAAAVAAQKPDLIIHVGDYHYRETPCPAGNTGCAGSPFGDTWQAWRADFFDPASALLAQVPWVMVRGNHEECRRAGQGWSRALDPGTFDAVRGCNEADAPFAVPLGNVTLAVVDVALVPEPGIDSVQAAQFRAQYASLATMAKGPTWLLQHRPIWSVGGSVAGLWFGDNPTLAAAARDTLPGQVQLILSGHHHIFQVLGYAQDLPVQIVSGHGGDYLNPGSTADPSGWVINGVTVKTGVHKTSQFGFSMLESQSGGWVVTNYDAAGRALDHCGIVGRVVACASD